MLVSVDNRLLRSIFSKICKAHQRYRYDSTLGDAVKRQETPPRRFLAGKAHSDTLALLEHEASAYAVGDERLRQLTGECMCRLPAGTMSWHDQCRVKCFERSDGWRDERLKERASEMKSSDHRIYLLDSGQLLGVANSVDCPRVPTSCEDHKAHLLDMHHHCLVVMNQRVLLPLVRNAGIVDWETLLEGSRAMDLPRH